MYLPAVLYFPNNISYYLLDRLYTLAQVKKKINAI